MDAAARQALGERIRELRIAKALTQDDLAYKAVIGLTTLRYIETGRSQAQFQTLQKIAAALGVKPEALFSSAPVSAAAKDVIIGDADGRPAAIATQQQADYAEPLPEADGGDDMKRRDFLKSLSFAATTVALPALGALAPNAADARVLPPLILAAGQWTPGEAEALAALMRDSSAVTPQAVARAIHEWLVIPPPQTVQLTAGRRIDATLASTVEKRVERLWFFDDFAGGRDLLTMVEKEVALTATLLREAAYSEIVGRRLLVSIADLCRLASWVAADADLDVKAVQYTGLGLKAAHAADDRVLAADLISRLAYLRTNKGDFNDGILYSQTALHGVSGHASATTNALFHERVVWAYASAGQQYQAEAALVAAERDFARSNREHDPKWVNWLNADEIEIMAVRCFIKLGQPRQAIERLPEILKRYDQKKTRSAALYTSWLSEAHLVDRNIEAAAHHAARAAELASQTASTRIDARVIELSAKLRPFAETPSVKDFLETARALGYA